MDTQLSGLSWVRFVWNSHYRCVERRGISTWSTRVSDLFVGIGSPPPPLPQASVSPTLGGATLACGWVSGGTQCGRLDRKPGTLCSWKHLSPQTKETLGGVQDRSSFYLYFNWWQSYFSVHRGYCSTLPRPVLHTHHKIPHPSSFHQLTHTQSLIFWGLSRATILEALSRWVFSLPLTHRMYSIICRHWQSNKNISKYDSWALQNPLAYGTFFFVKNI